MKSKKLLWFVITAFICSIGLILTNIPTVSAGVNSEICGDINDDSTINVLDLVFLINYMYTGGETPVNLDMCDVNSDKLINLLDATYLIAYLYQGGPAPNCSNPGSSGTIISHSACKSTYKTDFSDTLDCIDWDYLDNGELQINHINAGFNCCPNINADFYISGDTIIITESETYGEGGPCLCLCLFDVSYSITSLPEGVYHVKIIGVEVPNNDYLETTIDLAETPSGSYCVYRDEYPWGESIWSIYGTMTGHTDCLVKNKLDSTYSEDCVEYIYDVDHTLYLTHFNDLFNCCPDELYAEIDIHSNIITITEYEDLSSGGCDCVCLYNLNYELYMVPPGLWNIRIDNPYYYDEYNGGMIEFQVDLTEGVQGYFCVDRPYLPW